MNWWRVVGALGLVLGSFNELPKASAATAEAPKTPTWQQRIEADWLTEELLRADTHPTTTLTTRDDAKGGCDGMIDGTWGFHTGQDAKPWWQVDLEQSHRIGRIVIWNRCQASERAARLAVQLSADGRTWRTVYQHAGGVFFGFSDQKPLEVTLTNATARFIRVQLPGTSFLHLEEVQVFGVNDPAKNLALHKPADQSSVSQWSAQHQRVATPDWMARARSVLETCERLAVELREAGIPVDTEQQQLRRLAASLPSAPPPASVNERDHANTAPPPAYWEARRLQRRLALANPLLNFDTLLFTKRVPPSFNHMSDQYYGWWSKPGGGIYLLRGLKSDSPKEQCLTTTFQEAGSFLRPTLSYDGKKVLFAWCRYYPALAGEANKLDKRNVPEDAFYHLFEMNRDGTAVRRLTHGKYDDFDGRYLPDGRIVFLSTRRGQFVQVGRDSAAQTMAKADLPDCYVRCGGGPERPVAVYTLHTMNADGSGLNAISPFEMFEWTPEVARDGSILYSRWDYIDRDNMPYMGLWTISPDGANARLVYGNYTKSPHCTFEPKPVPGSHKIMFTASAHHAQTMGSLVLLDPSVGTEGADPIARLTPEVPFPEIEGWPKTYYANPWPLSERFHLVAWGHEGATVPGPQGWNRWHAVQRPSNGMALYWFDAATGSKELLWADGSFACGDPIPVSARPLPPRLSSALAETSTGEGRLLLSDIYLGLKTVKRGEIKALRIVAVPPKTHPTMNLPNLGITRDDPGKCVLGTVPVEADGSAHFRVPAGVIVFFQALDARGLTLQTMRSVTHVQPGQTLSCIGCHEHRHQAPTPKPALAALRPASKITPGPSGSWTLRFDQLVQPVLDQHCVSCHNPKAKEVRAARFDLSPAVAYEALVSFGKPNLRDQVWDGYRRGYSVEREGPASRNGLTLLLENSHYDVKLGAEDRERLFTWMDTYAQRAGAFSPEQEKELDAFRQVCADLLSERQSATKPAVKSASRPSAPEADYAAKP